MLGVAGSSLAGFTPQTIACMWLCCCSLTTSRNSGGVVNSLVEDNVLRHQYAKVEIHY
jgi:hypothetical protein